MEITFWLRAVQNSKSMAMVYCAVSINGDREGGAFSTGVKVVKSDWCKVKQRITDKNGKVIQNHVDNQILDKHYADLKTMFLQLSALQKPLNARKMKEYYCEGFDFKEMTFLFYAEQYVEKRNKLVGKLISKATAIRSKQWLNRIKVWLKARKQEQLLLSEIKIKQFNDFVNYQLTEAKFTKYNKECIGYDSELVRKDASFLKTIIKEAYKEELIEKNLIRDEKIVVPKENKEVIFLEDFELDKIHHYQFANENLQRIADLFVFQSYTGFAYVDLMNFDYSKDTIIAPDGKVWISKDRTKSTSQALVPFFKKSRIIWEKYQGVLPKIANGNYNAYLKEIALIVGIGKNITTHVARRTAAMLFLEHNCDLDTVAKMCGHNNAKMTKKYYTKIRIQRITAQLNNIGRLEW